MSEPLLELRDIHLAIGRGGQAKPILRGVNLIIQPGEIHGLVGESGGGKTMVGKAIVGALPSEARVSDGLICYKGRDVVGLPERERRKLLGRDISMILQQPTTALNPVFRIERQMTDVLRARLGLNRQAARLKALELLASVQIDEPARVLRQYPHELSGGMCQRVVIAIAFACKPNLIIADEPTTALDVTVQFEILRLLRQLQRETGTAILFITHDLGVVAKLCHTISIIFAGRILEHGTTEALFAEPSHPYTAALLAATPRLEHSEIRPRSIPNMLTDRLWRDAVQYDATRRHA